MIALKDVQAKEQELIAAAAAWAKPDGFAGALVLVDDGKQHNAEQLAMREVGHVCTALLPLNAKTLSQGGTAAILDAQCGVAIQWNAEKSTANIFDLIEGVKSAVLGYSPNNPNDRFKLDESDDSLLLTAYDDGVLSFTIFFRKRCAF